MRTVQGPLCTNCGKEVVRVEYKNEHGYVHGYWTHKELTGECLMINVNWVVTDA